MANGRQGTLGPVGRAIKGLIYLSRRIHALLEEGAIRAEGHEFGMDGGPELQVEILNLLRHFTPRKVVGFDKIRVGRCGDGGYVLLNDFAGVETALSFNQE